MLARRAPFFNKKKQINKKKSQKKQDRKKSRQNIFVVTSQLFLHRHTAEDRQPQTSPEVFEIDDACLDS
jgi:hypothetical protein